MWNGFLLLFFTVFQNGFESSFPFYGIKHLYLPQERYCLRCFKQTDDIDYFGTCHKCQTSLAYKKFQCLIQRAGLPFNDLCNPQEEPLCGDNWFCEHYCQQEHVIYLSRFGQHQKIGISGRRRGGVQQSYRFRLADQGLDEAIVFVREEKPLDLLNAQMYEQEIAELFQIPTSITFEDRQTQLEFNLQPSVSLATIASEIQAHYQELAIIDHYYPSSLLIYSEQVETSLPYILSNCIHQRFPSEVSGYIYYSRGELAIVKEREDQFTLINLRHLTGRTYYDAEG